MAGYANSKIKLQQAEERVLALEAELAQYQRENRPKVRAIVSRDYAPDVIDELIRWSDEGQFLDECLASWGIGPETWEKWLEENVELRAAVGPARARARASMLRTLREALRNRTAFPVSLADRIIAYVEKEGGGADAKADSLVRLEFCPRCAAADPQSVANQAQAVDIIGQRATLGESHS